MKGTVSLLGNAGILVSFAGLRFLVDGLYCDLNRNFSDIPLNIWEKMREGKGSYANIDYLLFSHWHYDHFYLPYFLEYMEHNRVKGVLFPPEEPGAKGVSEALAAYGEKAVHFDRRAEFHPGEDMTIKRLQLRHVDKAYYQVTNQCIWMELGGKRLMFLSDADYLVQVYKQGGDLRTDIAFVTPIFYNHPKGREILRNVLEARTIVICHIPFPKDDRFQYYRMSCRDVERFRQADETVLVWNQFGQSISF